MPCSKTDLRKISLTEWLIGLATLIVLAIALFPSLALARQQRNAPSCQQNLAQIGEATRLYLQDWDQRFYPNRFNCNNGGVSAICPGYLDANGKRIPEAANLSGGAELRYYWCYLLRPYLKSYHAYIDPQNPGPFYPGSSAVVAFSAPGSVGTNYGGQNSYGYNYEWLGLTSAATLAAVPRPASTLLATDTRYYVAAPDVRNASGLTVTAHCANSTCSAENAYMNAQGAQNTSYWKNLGNANWSESGGALSDANAASLIKMRHAATLNTLFIDGHVANVPYAQVVGDVCLWTTDIEGAHLNCK